MLCRCRALPSALRSYASGTVSQMTRTTSSPLRPISALPSIRPQPQSLQNPLTTSLLSASPAFALNPAQQTRSFSASAALGGRRSTYNPSRRVQKRRHGFLARVKSHGGRKIIMRRRARGKKNLSW